MLNKDGLETASEIRDLDPNSKIAMHSADDTIKEKAKKIGIDLFLHKPISIRFVS